VGNAGEYTFKVVLGAGGYCFLRGIKIKMFNIQCSTLNVQGKCRIYTLKVLLGKATS